MIPNICLDGVRIALISDVHGNQIALRAVLNDIDRAGVDHIVCLGDVATLGPDPCAAVATLSALQCPCIMGNHDAFLLDPELIHSYTQAPLLLEAVDWCRNELSSEALSVLATFKPTLEIALPSGLTLLLFHGTPRSNTENLLAETPATEVDAILEGYNADVYAGGHTHVQMLRQHRGKLIVNVGSVGLPFREFAHGAAPTLLAHAEYAILDITHGTLSINLKRVPLNIEALRKAMLNTENPLCASMLTSYG